MAEGRIDELRRRIERDPGSRLFAQLAEELRKEGELEEAIGIARAGLEKHPAYPSARLTLGRALLDSGDPAAARVELEAAVSGAPDNILASRLLGEALETLGDLGAALLQYQTTLQLAPNDGHVEARVRAIQERLGSPAPPAGGTGTPEVTKPMPSPALGEEGEEGGLPPTIRIRMPGDAPVTARAPLPPVPEGAGTRESAGTGGSKGETTLPVSPPPGLSGTEAAGSAKEGGAAEELPATLPMPGAEDQGSVAEPPAGEGEPAEPPVSTRPEEGADPAPEVPAEPVFAEDREESGIESDAGGAAPPEEDGAPEAPVGPPVVEAEEEGGPPDSDLAPTLPRSRAAEFAALDEGLPPTLPPGVITRVEEPEARGEDGPVSGEPAEGPVSEPPEERQPPAEEATEQPAEELAEPPPEQPVPHDGAVPEPPLSSATLAELYFQQGLLERALEVYRQVLEEEPGNESARERLREIEGLAAASASELPVPAPDEEDDREARRHALERAIERLEALLAVVRRGRS